MTVRFRANGRIDGAQKRPLQSVCLGKKVKRCVFYTQSVYIITAFAYNIIFGDGNCEMSEMWSGKSTNIKILYDLRYTN